MKVPFVSFADMHAPIQEALQAAAMRVIASNWFILGKELSNFEAAYAQFNQVQYAIGVGNGLEALHIALAVLGIGKGDEVIVPSNTYIATWLAVSQVGATPIPVEPRLDTYNLDPLKIEAAITPNTKAIMPVHLYGQACQMDAIMAIAEKYQLYIIEDNAQAQGATFNGKKTGAFGHINATSFYPGKNLGALGDAGAITSNDDNLAKAAQMFRNYGSEVKYFNEYKGINSRLDELQAAFLAVKLPFLTQWNAQRQALAALYIQKLAHLQPQIILPYTVEKATHIYHVFLIRTQQRDALQAFLQNKGISTLIHYPVPPHLQKAYTELGYQKGDFPIAETLAATALSLPLYPNMPLEAIDYICSQIEEFFKLQP